jgi:RNA polymerase sigma factor for flagellar operon FliA
MTAVGAYQKTALDRSVGDALVLRHAELVKRIAYHLAGRLPSSVEVDDLIQAGMLGLLEAAANFSTGRGASFETYAGIRIRGAMIDALRKLDWAPRSVHRKSREVANAIRTLEAELGREARDSEIAKHMNLTLEQYHSIIQDTASCQIASIEDTPVGQLDAEGVDPFVNLANEGFRASLAAAINDLPDRERLVMSLYYGDELNLKEIGAILQVTESRVCQLHGQALARLRARLTSWRDEPEAPI